MRTVARACLLALRDYAHEGLLSACSVLGLAAVLTPLLVLYGVKFGVVQTLTDRLLEDPRTLEISPVTSGHYTPDYLARLAACSWAFSYTPGCELCAAAYPLHCRHHGSQPRRGADA